MEERQNEIRPVQDRTKKKTKESSESVAEENRDRRMKAIADSGRNQIEGKRSFGWNEATTMRASICPRIDIIDGVETDAKSHKNTQGGDKSGRFIRNSSCAENMMSV